MTLTDMLAKWQGSEADQYGQRAKAGLCCSVIQDAEGRWDFCPEQATVTERDELLGVTTERAFCAKHGPRRQAA